MLLQQAEGFHWRKETIGGLDKHVGRCEILIFRGDPNARVVFPMGYRLNFFVVKDAGDGLERQNVRQSLAIEERHNFHTTDLLKMFVIL